MLQSTLRFLALLTVLSYTFYKKIAALRTKIYCTLYTELIRQIVKNRIVMLSTVLNMFRKEKKRFVQSIRQIDYVPSALKLAT